MQNESLSDMWGELRSSKLKMGFMIFLVVGAAASAFTGSLPDFKSDPISTSYDAMMEEIYLSGLTSAQEQAAKKRFIGERVAWKGAVIDVQKQGWSYVVTLSDGDAPGLTDILLEGAPERRALALSSGDTVSFQGKIDQITDGILTGYVHLTDVSIQPN